MESGRQPWLHELVTTFRAPTLALGGTDGQIRAEGAQGVMHADVRVLSLAVLRFDGEEPVPVGHELIGADSARFTGLLPHLGPPGPDPTVRVDRRRVAGRGWVEERIEISSTALEPVRAVATVDVAADLAWLDTIKSGGTQATVAPTRRAPDALGWSDDGVDVVLEAAGAVVDETRGSLSWPVDLAPKGTQTLHWRLRARVGGAPVSGLPDNRRDAWEHVHVEAADQRLPSLVRQSLADLDALRMTPTGAPDDEFIAGGAPWFCTLFGRDAIWTARFMLPFGTDLAAGTLRALASFQGTNVVAETCEQPGKIPHEVRNDQSRRRGVHGLPPLYYGSIDATLLWICLLHDAWRWGLAPAVVQELLPNLRRALDWLERFGDLDGDGFVEYVDVTGRGLANQGWKDSGDAIRFSDGSLAEPPVALCEVQGYAYEAALHGAVLLDAFGLPGADSWRTWAAALAERFRERFWVRDRAGAYPALALDAAKRPVDSPTTNIGYLLGTGMLNDAETSLVVDRVTGPALDSGFGLRTMAADAGGYSPLSYHCGSVWPHDNAIVIRALAAAGHADRALGAIEGLLSAGAHFGGRLPELYAGGDRSATPWPVPYPAACRPLAPTAGTAAAIVQALLGIQADVPGNRLRLRPIRSPYGPLRVDGLVAGTERFGLAVDGTGALGSAPDLSLDLDLPGGRR
ncbi:amylo-alpha-1,6-glucosidase [Flindersiella endophytica]